MAEHGTARISRCECRRLLRAALVGRPLEWFDFVIYAAAAALVFGKLFFPGAGREREPTHSART